MMTSILLVIYFTSYVSSIPCPEGTHKNTQEQFTLNLNGEKEQKQNLSEKCYNEKFDSLKVNKNTCKD